MPRFFQLPYLLLNHYIPEKDHSSDSTANPKMYEYPPSIVLITIDQVHPDSLYTFPPRTVSTNRDRDTISLSKGRFTCNEKGRDRALIEMTDYIHIPLYGADFQRDD